MEIDMIPTSTVVFNDAFSASTALPPSAVGSSWYAPAPSGSHAWAALHSGDTRAGPRHVKDGRPLGSAEPGCCATPTPSWQPSMISWPPNRAVT